jgi:hypothetical protein
MSCHLCKFGFTRDEVFTYPNKEVSSGSPAMDQAVLAAFTVAAIQLSTAMLWHSTTIAHALCHHRVSAKQAREGGLRRKVKKSILRKTDGRKTRGVFTPVLQDIPPN